MGYQARARRHRRELRSAVSSGQVVLAPTAPFWPVHIERASAAYRLRPRTVRRTLLAQVAGTPSIETIAVRYIEHLRAEAEKAGKEPPKQVTGPEALDWYVHEYPKLRKRTLTEIARDRLEADRRAMLLGPPRTIRNRRPGSRGVGSTPGEVFDDDLLALAQDIYEGDSTGKIASEEAP